MTLDRAELAGTGIAIAFHVVLISALSLNLAGVPSVPEPPAMEVELIDEIGLQAAASRIVPPPAQAPEIGEAPPVEQVPAPAAQPEPEPLPAPPRIAPVPSPRPVENRTARPARPPAPALPPRPAPRAARIGDDFLAGVADVPATPAAPAAPTISAADLASIQQAIRRRIQPCADRQVDPGPGANRISVTLNLQLSRGGGLTRPPRIVRTTGVDEDNARFEDRVKDLAVAAYAGCAPLSGLPPELYRTPQGGWSNINMTYRLP